MILVWDFAKRPLFAQFRRQAQILILKILSLFLWLKFSSFLALNKIERFAKVSVCWWKEDWWKPLELFYLWCCRLWWSFALVLTIRGSLHSYSLFSPWRWGCTVASVCASLPDISKPGRLQPYRPPFSYIWWSRARASICGQPKAGHLLLKAQLFHEKRTLYQSDLQGSLSQNTL